MKTPAILAKWLPANRYDVTEEFNRQSARNIFASTSSATWGAGKIGDTGYTKLWQGSPTEKGGKQMVIICKNELLGDLLNPE